MKADTLGEMIKVQLISLRARQKKALEYIYDTDLRIESVLLYAQIEALEKELENNK